MDLELTHLISAQCTRDCLCSLALLFQWPLTIVFYRLKKSRLSYDIIESSSLVETLDKYFYVCKSLEVWLVSVAARNADGV